MGALIRNYLGETIPPNGFISNISQSITSKFVVHKLPGADKDIIQSLGIGNRTYLIKGSITGTDARGWVGTLINHTGSIYLSGSYMGESINNVQVYYYDGFLEDVGGHPLERKFTVRAVEVK